MEPAISFGSAFPQNVVAGSVNVFAAITGTIITATVLVSVALQPVGNIFDALTDKVVFAKSAEELIVMVPPVPKTELPEVLAPS
jgi:hypothetical protein